MNSLTVSTAAVAIWFSLYIKSIVIRWDKESIQTDWQVSTCPLFLYYCMHHGGYWLHNAY